MLASIVAVVPAAPASAGPVVRVPVAESAAGGVHAPAAAVVPPLTLGLTALLSPSGLSPAPLGLPLAAASAPSGAPPAARSLPVLSRDVARDEAAAKLSAAGLPELLSEHGLVLWHVLRARTRSGERAFLTLSLPADGRPFERGADDPARKSELERRVAAAEKRIIAEVARVLEIPEDMIALNTRLIESCCGAGCQSCLLTKEKHAERWTGLPPRPEGGR